MRAHDWESWEPIEDNFIASMIKYLKMKNYFL